MSLFMNGSVSWDVGDILDEAEAVKDVTVTGAALGDWVLVSSSLDVIDLELSGQVTAADTVTVSLSNLSSGTLDMLTPTIHVLVISKTAMGVA